VKVRVLCGGRQGLRDWDIHDTFSSLRIMQRFGVKLRRQQHPGLHGNLILVDGACALTGSMNIDRSSFDLQRELGIESDEPEVVARLRETFEVDWRAAGKYHAPDPLDPSPHGAEALPPDPHPDPLDGHD
jgi:phosphatidylserine/phosphatidylglycerophosphate/cardiolipin synthase-like enzyme